MQYYIYEHQVRPDGVVNTLPVVSRSTLALGMSYFYERCSKMSANEQFVSAHVQIVDEQMNVKEKRDIATSYIAPEEEPAESSDAPQAE